MKISTDLEWQQQLVKIREWIKHPAQAMGIDVDGHNLHLSKRDFLTAFNDCMAQVMGMVNERYDTAMKTTAMLLAIVDAHHTMGFNEITDERRDEIIAEINRWERDGAHLVAVDPDRKAKEKTASQQHIEALEQQLGRVIRDFNHLTPKVGQIWHWQPMLSHATQRMKVVKISQGHREDCLVGTVNADREGWHPDETMVYNDLPHFLQSAVLVTPAPGDE